MNRRENNLKKSRKLALEVALYLASLKGGAIVEGFSSVSKLLKKGQKSQHFLVALPMDPTLIRLVRITTPLQICA